MNEQAGGLYGSGVLRPPYLQHGPDLARTVFGWAIEIQRRVLDGAKSALCLFCETEFPPNVPDAIAIIFPYSETEPEAVILSGVCEQCAAKHSDDEISVVMGRSVLPKGRQLPREHFSSQAGRA